MYGAEYFVPGLLLADRLVYPVLQADGPPIEVVQYCLFDIRPYLANGRGTAMRGVWAGDKPSNPNYRPSLDGFSSVDPLVLRAAIYAVIASGAAVQFSCTRDFGALVVTVLDGNDRHKQYPTDAQEIAQCVEDLRDSFTSPQETPPQSSASRKR